MPLILWLESKERAKKVTVHVLIMHTTDMLADGKSIRNIVGGLENFALAMVLSTGNKNNVQLKCT